MWRRDVTSQNFEVLKKEIVMSLSHFKNIMVINIIYLLIHYGMVSSPPKYRISLLQLKNFWISMSEGKNLRVTMRALILCNKNQNKMIQLDFRQVGYYVFSRMLHHGMMGPFHKQDFIWNIEPIVEWWVCCAAASKKQLAIYGFNLAMRAQQSNFKTQGTPIIGQCIAI